MEDIKSSLLNSDEMKYVKLSLERAAEEDNKAKFRVKTLEYINDSSSNNNDMYFFDMLEFVRFLKTSEAGNHIAYTDENKLIYLNCPDAPNGPGEKIRVWDFIYCHECLHQLWETFGVRDKIIKEGIEYDHMLLNIASDCVINDYLLYYRKKEPFTDGVFPDILERDYGVKYDRKKDTQYSLYIKLLNEVKENKEKYDKLKNDKRFKDTIDPKSINHSNNQSQSSSQQINHSDDYIKGWTDGIQDVLDKKVDPKTYTPRNVKNDYDKGYNDVLEEIKNGVEKGIKMSDSQSSNSDGSDLPQIPWKTDSQSISNSQSSPEDNANDAQQSADQAKDNADKAQEKADKAKEKAQNSNNPDDKEAAKTAQDEANKAKEAAKKAQEAANKAKEAAKNGNNNEASKQADAAREAAKSSQSIEDSIKRAKDAAKNAEKFAKDAENNKKDKKLVKDAKEAADKAKEAADKAEKLAKESKEAKAKGNIEKANKLANDAAEQARIAEDNERIAKNASEGKETKKDSNTNSSNNINNRGAGKSDIDSPIIETPEDLEEIRKKATKLVERWSKKLSGDFGQFISKCKSSQSLKKDGLVVNVSTKGTSGWNQQMNKVLNTYVKNKIFQKKRQYQTTYSRIKRGSSFVKFGEPIIPGRKIKEDKMNLGISFYIDISWSISSCIDQIFKASYIISDALKKQFGKDPIIDKTEFRMFVFNDNIHEIKWGTSVNASGGTCEFEKILKFIKNTTSEYLINVIITDAQFPHIDQNAIENLLKEHEGCLLFITNSPNRIIENIAKKYSTKLFYIEADTNFTIK